MGKYNWDEELDELLDEEEAWMDELAGERPKGDVLKFRQPKGEFSRGNRQRRQARRSHPKNEF